MITTFKLELILIKFKGGEKIYLMESNRKIVKLAILKNFLKITIKDYSDSPISFGLCYKNYIKINAILLIKQKKFRRSLMESPSI
jgi:hypothetical protein